MLFLSTTNAFLQSFKASYTVKKTGRGQEVTVFDMASNFVRNYSKKNSVNVNVLNNVCIYFSLCVSFGFFI